MMPRSMLASRGDTQGPLLVAHEPSRSKVALSYVAGGRHESTHPSACRHGHASWIADLWRPRYVVAALDTEGAPPRSDPEGREMECLRASGAFTASRTRVHVGVADREETP